MKLNYKKVIFTGFAFFLICAFWQAYDNVIPLILTNKFGMNQTWSGVIMALDNLFALFLLPLFGALSDKTNTKFGRRTPYIFIGTICAVLVFIFLPLIDTLWLFILALLLVLFLNVLHIITYFLFNKLNDFFINILSFLKKTKYSTKNIVIIVVL